MLEGEFRPTHFRGVATVVMKLFQLAPADRAYFGRKDYQQTLVVRQMVADLDVPIDVRVCPTVREPDGLAMSSRNRYLTPDERRRALVLSRSLRLAEELVAAGERNVLHIRQKMTHEIESVGGVQIQYIAIVADGTLTPVERIDGPTTIAIAATVGKTRLIDNTVIGYSRSHAPREEHTTRPLRGQLRSQSDSRASPTSAFPRRAWERESLMCSELFRIPYEVGGVPIFGVGVLLAIWADRVRGNDHRTGAEKRDRSQKSSDRCPCCCSLGLPSSFLPRVFPEGLPVRGYGLMLLVGITSGVGMAMYRARQGGLDPEIILSLAIWLVVCGVVGARLFYVTEYWDESFAGKSPRTRCWKSPTFRKAGSSSTAD